jgi:hypothetical protein
MVPEGACLVGDVELIQEGLIRANRTLIDSRYSISIVGAMLEDTVPMLVGYVRAGLSSTVSAERTMEVARYIVSSVI